MKTAIVFIVHCLLCYIIFCIHVYQVCITIDNHYHKYFLMVCFISNATEAFKIDEMYVICMYVCM